MDLDPKKERVGLILLFVLLFTPFYFANVDFVMASQETGRPTADNVVQLNPYPSGPNSFCVDETAQNGDSDYVFSNAQAGLEDTYVWDEPQQNGSINWVRVYVWCRETSGASGSVKPLIYHVNTYYGNEQSLTTSYVEYYQTWYNDPFDDDPWTWSDLSNIKIGVWLKETSGVDGTAARCTQIYAVVDYGPSTAAGIDDFGAEVVNGSTNSVIFVYPDTSGPKPAGVVGALFTDWSAIGILIGLSNNAQYSSLDTNAGSPLMMNTSTGQPGASNMGIVTVGGPIVHSVVHWLEGSLSPVYFSQGSGNLYFKARNGTTLVTQPVSTPASSDHFVIYTVVDSSGNKYFVFYGFGYRGSMAATYKMLEWVQNGQLNMHTGQYEIWRWDDTNGDGIVNPSPTDTYTLQTIG
ncbi:hypothetical protein A3K80_03135 [Candidatus Bathyarchaeota archaeon RBG_13_38_9]|nr:MAG: hypothetical protein A3K80_03135 [Candidatus Bathyarchaeota archaeon RBG_13_38_9]